MRQKHHESGEPTAPPSRQGYAHEVAARGPHLGFTVFSASKEDHFRSTADMVFGVLGAQKIFLAQEEYFITDPSGRINGKALGYVLGFFDVLLQQRRLDIRDEDGVAALHSLLARLFPIEVAKVGTFVAHLKKMESEADVMNGVMLGGQQAIDLLRTQAVPVRWATCF